MSGTAMQHAPPPQRSDLYIENTALSTLSRRCVENHYQPEADEMKLLRQLGNVSMRNFVLYGMGGMASTYFTLNQLKQYRIYRIRLPLALLSASVLSSVANNTAKRQYIRELVVMDSALGNELRIIIEELEGKNGPWLSKYGVKNQSDWSDGTSDGFGDEDLPRVVGARGKESMMSRPIGTSPEDWNSQPSSRKENDLARDPDDRKFDKGFPKRPNAGLQELTQENDRENSYRGFGLDGRPRSSTTIESWEVDGIAGDGSSKRSSQRSPPVYEISAFDHRDELRTGSTGGSGWDQEPENLQVGEDGLSTGDDYDDSHDRLSGAQRRAAQRRQRREMRQRELSHQGTNEDEEDR